MAQTLRAIRQATVVLLLAAAAPGWTASEIDRDVLMRRPLALWDQAQREFGFAHWDHLYPARVIARGPAVRALPVGAPLAGFAAGGVGAVQLQRNVEDFQLAGIVVLHQGRLRLEHYARGHSAAGRWVSFSLAKSLTSTLVGTAIKDGFIGSVDDAVTRYIPELQGSVYEGVTLHQLLAMSSGAKWNEDYKDPAADVALFYTMPVEPGTDATVSYMKTLKRDAAPGARWLYNTGETNLIGVALSRATRKNLATYASEKIWAPYGMESDASWMLDRSGHEHAGCCIQASTRDYARLGQFMLDGGRVDGRPILPEGWLRAATRKQVDIGRPGFGYGYQWWTRDNGTYNAYGIHGQVIHIDPSRGLVIALNSATQEANFSPASIEARIALFDAIRAAVDAEPQAGLRPR
jgi:CubicO group peptidase (beta-lactamase class C family)